MTHQRYTRTAATPDHAATLNTRQLRGSAEYYYHRYRLTEERLHAEVKLIIAGDRIAAGRLRRRIRERDEAYAQLDPFLLEICRRLRHESDAEAGSTTLTPPTGGQGGASLRTELREKARRIAAAGKREKIEI